MSKKSASEFFATLKADTGLLGRVRTIESVAGIVAVAKERGFEFTEQEYEAVDAMPIGGAELSDDQLQAVAGGSGGLAPKTQVTSCGLTIPTAHACTAQTR
jgi:predicted ribosomally synthesized peptide with nif11-like leader